MGAHNETPPIFPPCYNRRSVLQAVIGLGLGGSCLRLASAQDVEPRNARPQADDHLVFSAGERKGAVITPAELSAGKSPVMAYPMDPDTGVVRDGSRLNQVLLLRFAPAELTEETRARSVEGIVAYSAVCTHTGCDVSDWQDETKTLMCFCHYSKFDPKDGARVVSGPAPRRLAALPLKVADNVLMAAGGFIGRVGFKQD